MGEVLFWSPFVGENIFAGVFLYAAEIPAASPARCCPIGEVLPHRQVLSKPPVGENIFAGVFHESSGNSYCPTGEVLPHRQVREPKMAVPRRIILEPWARHSRQSPLMPIERCSMFVSCAFARS